MIVEPQPLDKRCPKCNSLLEAYESVHGGAAKARVRCMNPDCRLTSPWVLGEAADALEVFESMTKGIASVLHHTGP